MSPATALRFGALHRFLSRVNALVGRAIAWLTLLMVLTTAIVVILRYGFDRGSVALQESVTYMHCMVFMLGAAMTLERGGHVRVDIFYRDWPARRRALVDLLGSLFLLLPFTIFILCSSSAYVAQSWSIRETSMEPGGLPAVFLLKSLIPAMAVMLIVQGVADALRNALVLLGLEPAAPAPTRLAPEERL